MKGRKLVKIRPDALRLLTNHGISMGNAQKMLGKTFVAIDESERSYLLENGYFVSKAAVGEPDFEPSVIKDFMNLL